MYFEKYSEYQKSNRILNICVNTCNNYLHAKFCVNIKQSYNVLSLFIFINMYSLHL